MNQIINSGADLRRVAADLKRAGEVDLRKSLAKNIREAVKPLVPELRSAIKSLPSKGHGTGLRDKTARGVQVKVSLSGPRVGARVRVDPRLFPADAKSLPKRLEGIGRWRHPVFGTDTWVTQAPHPYFYNTILPHKTRIQTQVAQVLEDTARAAGFN